MSIMAERRRDQPTLYRGKLELASKFIYAWGAIRHHPNAKFSP